MNDATKPIPPRRLFQGAREEAETAKQQTSSAQTEDPAYRLAFQDMDFLLREDLRPVRFQLELLKPELLLDEANIASTFVIYGSARIPEPDKADALIEQASTDEQRRIAEKLKEKSRFYDEARKLARLASRVGPDANGQRHFVVCSGGGPPIMDAARFHEGARRRARLASRVGPDANGQRHFVVCSGGGPSIMEAANRGAQDMGQESIGLNIVLPHEQLPNPYVTPDLSFQFHYFALRKMHFLLRARAVAVFPGGFGTFDEAFELLTLVQTGKVKPLPILFFGREFWERVVDFGALVEEGVVAPDDLKLFAFVDTAEEAWKHVCDHYAAKDEQVTCS